jgi:hypothetical protein
VRCHYCLKSKYFIVLYYNQKYFVVDTDDYFFLHIRRRNRSCDVICLNLNITQQIMKTNRRTKSSEQSMARYTIEHGRKWNFSSQNDFSKNYPPKYHGFSKNLNSRCYLLFYTIVFHEKLLPPLLISSVEHQRNTIPITQKLALQIWESISLESKKIFQKQNEHTHFTVPFPPRHYCLY